MIKRILILFILFFTVFSFAQNLKVNDTEISLEEFNRLYSNNIKSEGREKAVSDYIDFTLINQEAEKINLDTTQYFKKLYGDLHLGIKNNYLRPKFITDSLMNVAYNGVKGDERKIGIYFFPYKNPFSQEDINNTEKELKALYKEVCDNQVDNGKLKKAYQEKYRTKPVWIRTLDVPYFFEKEAKSTDEKKCSEVKSNSNGIYFVHVEKVRASLGFVGLSLIKTNDENGIKNAFNALEKGDKFKDVVEKFSKDDFSKSYHGKLREYGSDIPELYYNEVKDLQLGSYTKPFREGEDWAILKLDYKYTCEDKKLCKDRFSNKIKSFEHNNDVYRKHLIDEAKKNIPFTFNQTAIKNLKKIVGKNFFANDKAVDLKNNQAILTTRFDTIMQSDLLQSLKDAKITLGKKTDLDKFVDYAWNQRKDNFFYRNYLEHLESYNADYAKQISILKDAIKVNFYIERYIYEDALKDSLGQFEYILNNKENFTWPRRMSVEVFRFSNPKLEKKVISLLNKSYTAEKVLEHFGDEKDEKGVPIVFLTKGILSLDHKDFDSSFKPEHKIQATKFRGGNSVVRILKYISPKLMTVEEAGSRLRESYKGYKYNQRIKKLKENATISIPETFITK